MGMYNYTSDIETKFIEVQVPEIIKNSETLEEAINKSDELCILTQDRPTYGLDEVVTEMWNEHWSKYNMGGC